VLGSAVFGVGWGLVGYCPGPALTALGAGGGRPTLIFVAAMVAGMALFEVVRTIARAPANRVPPAAASTGG
jgi:uncharacterized membrane protein YedE/YeeE